MSDVKSEAKSEDGSDEMLAGVRGGSGAAAMTLVLPAEPEPTIAICVVESVPVAEPPAGSQIVLP